MNKSVALIALVALIAGAAFLATETKENSAFEQFKTKFGATWTAGEEQYRKIIFERNVEIINSHNADNTQSYKMGINQFSALTDEEFVNTYLTPMAQGKKVEQIQASAPLTVEVDWTTKNGVSPVKNQASCGSCWAFATTGALESNSKIHGTQVDLSEQQLVDCSGSYGNQGCNGGWPSSALNYVKAHGLAYQSEYGYKAVTQTCQKNGGSFKISAYSSASGCTGLQNAISSKPIAVTVDATNWSKYSSGIFTNCANSINHAVLLVGASSTYWKIKNSWGTSWGEKGFIRIASGNTCGLCQYAGVYPQ